jgi:predicted ATPase/DNA-binding CsgD family transcriptional regulator
MSDFAVHRRGDPVAPPLNRLVARRHDLDAAQRTLPRSRLMTFTGQGGVGKTRLALEVAYRARDRFPDGAWLVSLADLNIGADIAEMEAAVIAALGVSDQSNTGPREKLLSFLQTRKLLLVLDNCEHVLSSVRATLPILLQGAPNLRIVATSREPLGLDGEILHPVLPLTVPETGTPSDQLIADGSVSLLVERAHAVDPYFELTDDNAAAVVSLCRLLEGLPLAIELAAAKLRALTVKQVVERFGQRLTSLAAAGTPSVSRHQSMRSMVDWSYELCPTTAQVLWRRLSVFTATFDLELVESICAFGELRPDVVLDSIERLVAQSILSTVRGGDSMRYRLPAAIREVAADLAEQADETAELQRRHRDAMLGRAQLTLRQWYGPHQDVLIEQMSLDHASYVAALQWSIITPGEQQTALLLVASLRYHFLVGGRLAEGRMRMEAMLAAVTEPSPMRGECLWVATWIALLQGDHDGADRLLSELSRLARDFGSPRLAAHLHQGVAMFATATGDLDRAIHSFRAASDLHRAEGNPYLDVTARYLLACALAIGGRAQEALKVSSETAALCDQHGERNARAFTDYAAGMAYWTLGQLDEAEQSAHEVLKTQRAMGDGVAVALATVLCSWIFHDRGQFRHAADLLMAAGHVWRSLGTSLNAFGPHLSAFAEEHTPPGCHPPNAEHASATKSFDSLEDVIDFVLSAGQNRRHRGRGVSTPLSRREHEVAELIESGLSNREIAKRLVIAKRTADGHVERILAKLGFSSRAQVAAWMARRAS